MPTAHPQPELSARPLPQQFFRRQVRASRAKYLLLGAKSAELQVRRSFSSILIPNKPARKQTLRVQQQIMMPMEQWDLLYNPIYLARSKLLPGIRSLRLRWQHTTKQPSSCAGGKSAFVWQLLNYSMAVGVIFRDLGTVQCFLICKYSRTCKLLFYSPGENL